VVQMGRRARRPQSFGDRLVAGFDALILEDLYDAYGESCYRLAHHVVADPERASSVVHDVFLAVWAGTAVFDPSRGSVETWLLCRTHRFAIDAVRRHAPPIRAGEFAVAETQTNVDVSIGGRGTIVATALTKLSEAQRDVLQSMYVLGHTQGEIAELTGNAVSAIKTETIGALRQLRDNIAFLEPVAPQT
jgi:RNA polymerase sigma-70 factor, ECF subfamily